MKRILFIGPVDGGGISTINKEVIRVLSDCGQFVSTAINTTPYRKRCKALGYMILYILTFGKLLLSRRDIVYLQISQTGFLHQSIFLLIAKMLGCRTVAHFHAKSSVSGTVTPRDLKRIMQSQRYIDTLIVLAESSKADLLDCGWKKPIHVIPNFVDASDYPDVVLPLEKRQYLLYIGRMHEKKGIFKVLDLAALLPEQRFVFIGPFESEQCRKRFVDRTDNLQNVSWIGPVYGNAKIEHIARSSFLVSPSETEVFPLTLLESSLCGAIPLATDVGMISTFIKDGSNGFLIDADNPEQAARVIKELLLDPDRYGEISANCRVAALERHTSSAIGSRLIEAVRASTAMEREG